MSNHCCHLVWNGLGYKQKLDSLINTIFDSVCCNSTGQALPDDAVFKDFIVNVCRNMQEVPFNVFRQLQAHEHIMIYTHTPSPPMRAFKQRLSLLLYRGCSCFWGLVWGTAIGLSFQIPKDLLRSMCDLSEPICEWAFASFGSELHEPAAGVSAKSEIPEDP